MVRDRMHRGRNRRARGHLADTGSGRSREIHMHHVRRRRRNRDRHRVGWLARPLRRGVELDERCRISGADSVGLGTRRSRRRALHLASGSRSPEFARRCREPHSDQDRVCTPDVARCFVRNPRGRRTSLGAEVAVDKHRAVCTRRFGGDRNCQLDCPLARCGIPIEARQRSFACHHGRAAWWWRRSAVPHPPLWRHRDGACCKARRNACEGRNRSLERRGRAATSWKLA